jgi:hypothetical protein
VQADLARVAVSHPVFSGIPRPALARLLAELREPWAAKAEGQRRARRGRDRVRRAGAGRWYRLRFEDRVLVTLVVLRFQLPHACLAVLFGVDRATITRAVHQVRPLLAARGFQTPEGPRLRTLADVFAYADQHGIRLRVDGTEIQVRRPKAGRPGRRAFVSGKRKQNTLKFIMITSRTGRVLWWGAPRPGRMHDQTAARTEGIAEQLRLYPNVQVLVDAGYRGLANEYPDQVTGPPKPPPVSTPENTAEFAQARKAQSSVRISVEHGIAETKAWRPLQRWIGKREHLPETALAIATLASDRVRAT